MREGKKHKKEKGGGAVTLLASTVVITKKMAEAIVSMDSKLFQTAEKYLEVR